jgi:hypothetical protein
MPARRKKEQSRGLAAVGLIAVTAGTLLTMAWVIFPTAALATVPWTGNGVTNGQLNNVICDANNTPNLFWVFTGSPAAGLNDVTLTVNGQTFDMDQAGGANSAWQATTPFFPLGSITASVDGVNGTLTISHGCPGETTTTTTVPTTTTTVPTTTTTVPTTTTTVPTTTTTTTTTTGGGGGGGTTTVAPTSTTTSSPTIAPTTVHQSKSETESVAPTTVRAGGTAFTGVEDVVPLGVVALTLLTGGSGLLWAGSRRRRNEDDGDE